MADEDDVPLVEFPEGGGITNNICARIRRIIQRITNDFCASIRAGGGIFQSSTTITAVSKCYSSFVIVLAILLSFIWASPSPTNGPKDRINPMEGLYTYLTSVSIAMVVMFTIPSYLTPAFRTSLRITKKEVRSSFGWSVVIIGCFLGTMSIIYYGVEFLVVQIAFKDLSKVFLMKLNSVLEAVLTFLEMLYLYKSKQGEVFYPGGLEGLYDMGKMHLLSTNVCLWIKILTKETVVFSLDQLKESGTVYKTTVKMGKWKNETSYIIPAFSDPCDAINCFNASGSDENCRSMLAMEEGFSCKKEPFDKIFSAHHFGSYFYPFLAEFATLMIFVLYEMLGQEHSDRDKPATSFTMNNLPGVGLLIGMLPNISVWIFLILKLDDQHPILVAVLTVLILISVVAAFFLKVRISLTNRSNHSTVDENILFFTFNGLLLYITAYMIPHIMISATGRPANCYEIIYCTITIIANMLQVILVSNLLKKTIPAAQHALRNTLTFIAMCNLSFWIYDSLLDHNIRQSIQRDYYGLYGWAFIWRVASPLLVFFRFHIFVTLIRISWRAQLDNQEEDDRRILQDGGDSVHSPASGDLGRVAQAGSAADQVAGSSTVQA